MLGHRILSVRILSVRIRSFWIRSARIRLERIPSDRICPVGAPNGHPQAVLNSAATTTEAKALKPVIKMLFSDYMWRLSHHHYQGTFNMFLMSVLGLQKSGELNYRNWCFWPALLNPSLAWKRSCHPAILTQFLLDCTSKNLDNDARISVCDPTTGDIY